MADQPDPAVDARLEASLRDALRHDAEALPFTLTLADVEAARRARHTPIARLRAPVALLASAAAIVIVVAGLAAWRGASVPPTGTESPNPLAGELKSYEDLAKGISLLDGAVIAQGQDLVGDTPENGLKETVIGTVPAHDYIDIVFDCRGRSLSFGIRGPNGEFPGGARPCDQRPTAYSIPTLDVPADLVVIAPRGTVWRVVVGGTSNQLAAGLQSYEQLELLLPEAERGLFLLARAEDLAGAPADPATGETVITGIPAYNSLDVVIDCRGGAVRVWVRTGMQIGLPSPVACTGQPFTYRDAAGSGFAEAEIVVAAEPGVVWRLVAGGTPPSPTPRPTVVAPTGVASFEELAAGALSTREIARAEGSAEPSDAVIEIARLSDLWNLEIALACTGPGSIEIRATGTSDDQSSSTFGCGGGAGSMLVTALDTAADRAPDAALVATVPAGTAWRTIVFDHSADVRPMPKAPAEAFPMTDVGAFAGLVRAGEPPTEVSTTRSIPHGATIEVAMGCTGDPSSLVHIVLDGVATDLACLESNLWHAVPDGDGTSVLEVSSDDSVWVDIALRAFTQEEAGAVVTVPSATLRAPNGSSSAAGFTTCLRSYSVPGGASADVDCIPTPYVIPEARAVTLRAGEVLELVGGLDWAMDDALITYVPSSAAGNATPNESIQHPDATGPGVEGGFAIDPLPEGDWTLRIEISGTLADGTIFTAQQLFRVVVER